MKRFWPVLGLLALVLALRIPFLSMTPDRDEGAYAVVAQAWEEGRQPLYGEYFEHRPPGVFAVYAAGFKLWGPRTEAFRIMAMAHVAFFVLLVYYALLRRQVPHAGWIAAIAAVSASTFFAEGAKANTELFMLPWLWLFYDHGILALERPQAALRWAGAAGLWLAIASLFKQIVLIQWLALAAPFILAKHWKPLAALTAAAVLPWIALYAALFASHTLSEGHYAMWTYNSFYLQLCSWSATWFNLTQKGGKAVFLDWLPLWMLTGWSLIRMLRKDEEERPVWHWYPLWFQCSLLGVLAGRWMYAHYFLIMLPCLMVGVSYGFLFLKGLSRSRWKKIGWGAVAAAAWIPLILNARLVRTPVDQLTAASLNLRVFYDGPLVAAQLRSRMTPQDTLFVWGIQPELYFLTQRPPVGNEMSLAPFWVDTPRARIEEEYLIKQLEETPPTYLVYPQDQYVQLPSTPRFIHLLRHRYALAFQEGSISVYRNKDKRS